MEGAGAMETRRFMGRDISLLGFGLMRLPRVAQGSFEIDYSAAIPLIDHAIANGVNYFDTAYTYRGSQDFVGEVLSKYPRSSYSLATKCPPWKLKNEEDFEQIFSESLERCKTDYFDFYLVHNLAEDIKTVALEDKESFILGDKLCAVTGGEGEFGWENGALTIPRYG
jgi:predicted aldo/keto reductase-like oxidoreductase